MKRSVSWLKQAESDLKWARVSEGAGFYAQACFIAQQVAEKSLKAIAYHRKATQVKSHSLLHIVQALKINGTLEEYSRQLDLYYLATRYPDALPDHAVPAESFSKEQALAAIEMAEKFVEASRNEIVQL